MLMLDRRVGERIMIGEDIVLVVVEVQQHRVHLGSRRQGTHRSGVARSGRGCRNNLKKEKDKMPKVEQQTNKPATKRLTNGTTQTSPLADLFEGAVALSDMEETGHKFLVFGPSGAGKTTLACDFPKPLLLIRPEEVEDGSRSVRLVKGVSTPPRALTDPDQLLEICEGQRRTNRYKTLVLDGVTDMQSLTVKKIMGFQDVPIQMSWGLVAQPDWNKIGILLQGALRDLLRLAMYGTNVVIVGGERVVGGKEGDDATTSEVKIPKMLVALTPGSAGWLHKVCDYNVYAFTRPKVVEQARSAGEGKKVVTRVPTGKQEFCLRIDTHDFFGTKFRKDKNQEIPDVLIDPTFAKLEHLINGGS